MATYHTFNADIDTDIANLHLATEAFTTDYADGECTCLDNNKANTYILPGENFHLPSNSEGKILAVQWMKMGPSIWNIIDELVTPDTFLYEDAMQMKGNNTRIMGAGIPWSTNDASADILRAGAFFDVGMQGFIRYTALEQMLFQPWATLGYDEDEDAGSFTPRLAELAYYDGVTQKFVGYTASNQLLNSVDDEHKDEVLPRIHRAGEDFEDWEYDGIVARELTSLSTNEQLMLAELPATNTSPIYELDGNTSQLYELPGSIPTSLYELDANSIPLTASNLRKLHTRFPRSTPLSTLTPLSPILEVSEPSSPGSSIAFTQRREYIKPLSTRRASFLSVSTSPSPSRPVSRESTQSSSPTWLDTFPSKPPSMLSKVLRKIFASDVWRVTPRFTIASRSSRERKGRSADQVRVRISWLS